MATEQATITQAITQAAIEATKQEVMVASEEVTARERNEAASMRPKIGRPLLQQLTFVWSSIDKYAEPRNFRMEVHNTFQSLSISLAEKVHIIKKNWLDRQGLKCLEALTLAEQKAYNTVEGHHERVTNSNHNMR